MKKIYACSRPGLLSLALYFLASAAGPLHAGAPLKINFQGRLEESGQPAEGSKSFVFKIYDAFSAGTLVWTSQAQSVPVANGVFSVVLETGTPVNLSTAVFAGARYVEITVDGVPLSPRQEMVSAPYALVAQALAQDAVIALSNLEKDPSSASVINTSTNAVDWTQLKNVPAGLSDGIDDGGATTFSTAAIVSGKFSDERVSITTGAFYGGFNGADQLVRLDGAGKLVALDGSALLNVNSGEFGAVSAATSSLRTDLSALAMSTGPLAGYPNWNTAYGWGNHGAAGYADAASIDSVAASTGTIASNLAAVALSTGPLTGYPNWNTAYGWGDHGAAGYAAAASIDSVAASTGTISSNLAAVAFSTGPLTGYPNWNTAYGWGDHGAAGYAAAASLNGIAASTGTLTVNLAAVALSTGSIAAQVNGVAASTGTLTLNLAAVALSTGPLAGYPNWNTAYGWGNHGAAGYAAAVSLDGIAASTGTLTVNLAAVVLSTGSIAAQVDSVAASTGTITENLAAVAFSTGSIAAQVDNVAASTGTLTVDLAAVVLSTGPLANSGNWSGALSVGGAFSRPVKTLTMADSGYILTSEDSTIIVDATDLAAGELNIVLPPAAGVVGRIYTIKRSDDISTLSTVRVNGSDWATTQFETIQGDSSFTLDNMWSSSTIQSIGNVGGAGTWIILSQN